MPIKMISYISSAFIVILAMVTLVFESRTDHTLIQPVKMFPYFSEVKHKIDKIDIRFKETQLSMIRSEGEWVIASADEFPADKNMIESLYNHIENIELIASKTDNPKNYNRLGLLNPTNIKEMEGEGIRLTLSVDQNKPYADFIIGTKLKSYKNDKNMRLFLRYASEGGAFLAQTTTDFNFSPSNFISSEFGMPKLDEVLSMKLKVKNKPILTLKRVYDPSELDEKGVLTIANEDKKPEFMPTSIKEGYKLLYPQIMTDYVRAFITQLKPIDAIRLVPKQQLAEEIMEIELTKGRLVNVNFWHTDNNHYMRIIRNDLIGPQNAYVYMINDVDYKMLIQPFERFLKRDNLAQKDQ